MRKPVEGNNIIVIGSGIGGLSIGILLSALKFNVTVVEKNPMPGGLMNSYRRHGIDCPVGVHYVGALDPSEPLGKMFSVLGINGDELFYRMGKDGLIDRYIFDDFTFDLPVGIDAYEKNLRHAFPEDAQALDVIMKNLRDIASRMMDPLFLINQGDPFSTMDSFRPMGDLLDELSASPGLRAVLAVPCQLIGVMLNDCPIIFHHMVVASYLFSSWRLKKGGSHMTDVFVSRFRQAGGSLLLKKAVTRIRTENGKVAGVDLSSGETLDADGVVAAIHPKVLLELLSPGDLRQTFQERIRTLDETDGILAVQASIDAVAHPELDYNIYRLSANERGFIEGGIFYQIREGDQKGLNLLSIITRSLYNDWRPWENTQTGNRGSAYEEKKLTMARELLAKAEGVFGPLQNAHLLDVFTPLTLRDYVNCPEGSCYGVLRSSRQLLKVASLNNIPIGGLCLAGQNALAPGVMGSILGSFAAVRQIIGHKRFAGEFHPQL
jgi:phytoene dehydrogenase-like protein